MAKLLYCSHLVMSIDHGQSSHHLKYYSGDELLEKSSFNIWFLGQMNIDHLDFRVYSKFPTLILKVKIIIRNSTLCIYWVSLLYSVMEAGTPSKGFATELASHWSTLKNYWAFNMLELLTRELLTDEKPKKYIFQLSKSMIMVRYNHSLISWFRRALQLVWKTDTSREYIITAVMVYHGVSFSLTREKPTKISKKLRILESSRIIFSH